MAFVALARAAVADRRRPPVDARRLGLSRHAELIAASRGDSPRPDERFLCIRRLCCAPALALPHRDPSMRSRPHECSGDAPSVLISPHRRRGARSPSPRTVRPARGDEQVLRHVRVETRIRARAGMRGGHGFVTACVRREQRHPGQNVVAPWLLCEPSRRAGARHRVGARGRRERNVRASTAAMLASPRVRLSRIRLRKGRGGGPGLRNKMTLVWLPRNERRGYYGWNVRRRRQYFESWQHDRLRRIVRRADRRVRVCVGRVLWRGPRNDRVPECGTDV